MPTRRRTKALASDDALEFEFYIADRLGMTVERMRREMTEAEFLHWTMYHARKAQRAELEQKRSAARQSAKTPGR